MWQLKFTCKRARKCGFPAAAAADDADALKRIVFAMWVHGIGYLIKCACMTKRKTRSQTDLRVFLFAENVRQLTQWINHQTRREFREKVSGFGRHHFIRK